MNWKSSEIMEWIENNCYPRTDEHYYALDKVSRALELYDYLEEGRKNNCACSPDNLRKEEE